MVKVCPRCGRTEKEVPFIGFFCRDCYLEMNPPIKPQRIALKVCPTCGRVFVGRWTEPSLDAVARWVRQHIKVSNDVSGASVSVTLGQEDDRCIEYRALLSGSIEGTPIQYSVAGCVEKVKEQCPFCARRAGGYYEAVIQLRGKRWEELYSSVLEMLAWEKDPGAFIAKEVPRKKGIDLFLGSKKVAEKIARRLRTRGAAVKFSFSLVTEKDGKPITREFVSVRFD